MPQYLNPQGVSYLWSKIKNITDKQLTYYSQRTEDWDRDKFLISQKDVLYIYLDHAVIQKQGIEYYIPGLKWGDGTSYLIDMPFLNQPPNGGWSAYIEHINNSNIHVTLEEKSFWNNKINAQVQEEELVLNRN